MRRPRRLVLAAATLGLAAAATGCSYMNPVQTHEFYQSGDGAIANIEAESGTVLVGVRNAIVVVHEGGDAELRGSLVNYTTESTTVELTGLAEGSTVFTASISVPAGETVELGSAEGEERVAVEGLDAAPGDIIDLSITSEGTTEEISLPITDTALDYYDEPGAQS